MRRLLALFAALVIGCLFIASCSESDDLGGALDDTTEDDGGTSDDDSSEDEGGSDDEAAEAIALLEDQGFSAELAECAVDAVTDQGVALSDLIDGFAFPDEELSTALALAGAECAEFADGLPAGAFDLEDPAVREGFITSFSVSSGFSETVAECVLDFLIDRGVEGEALLDGSAEGQLDPAVEQVVGEAVAACG